MRILRIATISALAVLAAADTRASASARAEILAGYGETSATRLHGDGGQQVIINQTTSEMPMQLPGMGPRQPKTGTGRLRGRALGAETGSPVRRAVIRISSPDIGAKTAMTDAEGRYEFRDLPAGRFNLSASKAGYVTMQYGQTRPFEQGKAIDLADAQVMDKADFQMPRGSKLIFRLEGTNIFNIVNYGQPGNAVPSGATSTTFGVIRTANAMRRLQVGLRLTF